MIESKSGSRFGADSENEMPIDAEVPPIDPALVMAVGNSRINSVVVCKIVERCGLRCISSLPDDTWKAMKKSHPALVILDGGADNSDCSGLLSWLGEIRRKTSKPAVILLTTRNFVNVEERHASIIDAVVSKPILPEMLQPIIQRYVGAR